MSPSAKNLVENKNFFAQVNESVAARITKNVQEINQGLIDAIRDEFTKLRETIQQQNRAIDKQCQEITALNMAHMDKMDELEQYPRRNSLRFFGISKSNNENIDTKVIKVARDIGVSRTLEDIHRCHRVSPTNHGKYHPIIVKLLSYRKRAEIFRNKRKLVGSGKVIRDSKIRNSKKMYFKFPSKKCMLF
ncbi:hypothetical protein R5R35_003562 [Gryllus longicercus]|uniref:Uncharacterized protein n=1 Tax=Gryllus longicercus TaxID=2509291 RepID=A0AAN9Z1T9_9ORTH